MSENAPQPRTTGHDGAAHRPAPVGAPLTVAARTVGGVERDHNEDAVLVAMPLLAIADGVGGAPAGAEAAALVLDALRRGVDAHPPVPAATLVRALNAANDAVRRAGDGRWCQGMAATVVTALVGSRSSTVAHAGDSRAYRWDGERLHRLTRDHSLVELLQAAGEIDAPQARAHPLRNVVVRAAGAAPDLVPDVVTIRTAPGDLLLLCSDGLTDPLDDDALAALCAAEPGVDRLASCLVAAARKAGGRDDISVLVARL